MVKPRQSGLSTAKRRAGWSLAFCAAAILLLVSQGVESPRIAAQGQSVIDGTLEVHYEDSYAGARLTHYLNTGTERIALRFARNPPERLLTGTRVRARGARRNGMLMLDTGADVSSLDPDIAAPSSNVSPLTCPPSIPAWLGRVPPVDAPAVVARNVWRAVHAGHPVQLLRISPPSRTPWRRPSPSRSLRSATFIWRTRSGRRG